MDGVTKAGSLEVYVCSVYHMCWITKESKIL